MPELHDPQARGALIGRLGSLRPDAQRQWGKMTVDQMLWHVSVAMEAALGRYDVKPMRIPIPKFMIKWVIIGLPWRRGKTPTAPEFVAQKEHDFEQERMRLKTLIDEFAAKPLDSAWADSAAMGAMTGQEWSRLQHKHVDYHLKQFGA